MATLATHNVIAIAIGMKGTGKSTTIRKLVQPCRRRLVLDTERSWKLEYGDVVIDGSAELLAYARIERLGDPSIPFRIVYRERDNMVMATAGAGLAYALCNLTMVVDELAWLCGPRSVPERLGWIPQFGRDRQINMVATTREPGEIHNLFITQADYKLFFHMEHGAGLRLLAKDFGRAFALKIHQLKGYQSLPYGNARRLNLLGREGVDGRLHLA